MDEPYRKVSPMAAQVTSEAELATHVTHSYAKSVAASAAPLPLPLHSLSPKAVTASPLRPLLTLSAAYIRMGLFLAGGKEAALFFACDPHRRPPSPIVVLSSSALPAVVSASASCESSAALALHSDCTRLP